MAKITETGALLRQLIDQKSKTAQGFSITDGGENKKNAYKLCDALVKKGMLYKASPGPRLHRYFATQQAANKWLVLHGAEAMCQATPTNIPGINPGKPTAALKKDAVIVDGPNVKRSYRPWIDRYAVSVPRLRIGQPGWSMTVGGSA